MKAKHPLKIQNLTIAYGEKVIQRDLNFTVNTGDIFVIIGGNGSGKSTLMRSLVGLQPPTQGTVLYEGLDFWNVDHAEHERIKRRLGVMFQGGALWSSLTLAENLALPLNQYTDLSPGLVDEIVSLKLALVGLAGYGDFYPAELSGGMKKRASLARAMALDPDILLIDEPSAGLDPLNARHLDNLILELRESLGTTIVLVTHELPSILGICNNSVFLDAETRTMIDSGNPKEAVHSGDPKVRTFLTRGEA
ncbi:MAG: polyamine ABC transporter ATP-binding protein [Desulfobacterales bacterium GWB2_56_26]|nr:MAG: polyamine ABC transporter ATP-binding protein [Desulfobacterales bacterium GWB2_56_26]